MTHEASVVVFIAQLATLLIAGRLAGELMQRAGQPPVIGQILAGVLLGPSVFGALAPLAWHGLFPAGVEQKAMLDAIAQLGIVLLLLMTGMETDLSVFRSARRSALSISLTGIVVPFSCGLALGLLMPAALLPRPDGRWITALFLGTALSISSVKIVALVVRDLGFVRRTVGQVIIGASILDDTIGWIIIGVTLGLAQHGTVDIGAVARSVLGTVAFLALSFTIGRRVVFRLIRWANDTLRSEMATISMLLAITALMALLTSLIGVHFVLGAFVAGVLIGQSPILTSRLDTQLRGLIVALFMPVFFVLAGFGIDASALARPQLLALTGGLILLASIGKFVGAFLGGRIGGLSYAESFAVGCGMNARGSTEIIVASIGLSMAALDRRLFTAIVAMAVVTTLAMPPMLRWALRRLPLSAQERARLEREEFESQGFLKQVERLLLAVDDSPGGQLASQLAGLLAGVRRLPTTVLHLDRTAAAAKPNAQHAERSAATVKAGAAAGDEEAASPAEPVDILTRSGVLEQSEGAIAAEAKKGYGLLIIGREPLAAGGELDAQIARSALRFGGPFAIVAARGAHRGPQPVGALNVLLPVTGTRVSRQGAEVAIALTQASRGTVTALHVVPAARLALPWRQRFGRALVPRSVATAAIREIVELGEHYGVSVQGKIRSAGGREHAILREAQSGRHDLIVMGVSPRSGEPLFFGDVAAELLQRAQCSLLLVSSDPVTAPAATKVDAATAPAG